MKCIFFLSKMFFSHLQVSSVLPLNDNSNSNDNGNPNSGENTSDSGFITPISTQNNPYVNRTFDDAHV